MKFKMDVMRGAVMAVLAVALLASCGGGTQIEAFVPTQVIVFGDESSYLEADPTPAYVGQGRKYTVNAVQVDATTLLPVSPTQRLCASNPIWVQTLAYTYGFSFPDCATDGYAVKGVMNAQVGAKVAQLSAQVTLYIQGPDFHSNDLVTVMVGTNDIIDAFVNSSDPVTAARVAGTAVGAEVVRITDRGAKVIVSTLPNLGLSPYAISRETSAPGTVALLSRMSEQFNTALRLKLEDVRDGGRAVGLVLADELVLAMVNNPTSYGLTNTGQGVCTAALPNCDMTTLDATAVATSNGYDWLWADETHLGANAHSRIGSLAVTRARNNPF